MIPLDDILALIFGMLFTIRKLDVSRREAAHYPHVREVSFDEWKRKELSSYRLGSTACFLKVAIGLGMWLILNRSGDDPDTVRLVVYTARGVALAWLASMIGSGVLAYQARKMRDRLGIVLANPPAPEDSERDSRG